MPVPPKALIRSSCFLFCLVILLATASGSSEAFVYFDKAPGALNFPHPTHLTTASPPSYRLNDALLERIGGDLLHSYAYGLNGTGVRITIYETGNIAFDHPAFLNRILLGNTTYPDETATHIAGIAAGSGASSPPNRNLTGLAPDANLISYGYTPSDFPQNDFYSEVQDVQNQLLNSRGLYGSDLSVASIGTHVATNLSVPCSWEGDYARTGKILDAIVRGSSGDPYIIVWAVGDERGQARCQEEPGYPFSTIPPPGSAKNPIHVGATYADTDTITSFSSFGPTDDGRIKPTVVAPGCESAGDNSVFSAVIPIEYGSNPEQWIYYEPVQCSTAIAAGAVGGLAALMIEQFRITFNLPGARPLPSTVKALLIHTSLDLGAPGPDFQHGYGLVDGLASVNAIKNQDIYEGEFKQENETHEFRYIVAEGEAELKVTLAWDDREAEANSIQQLINDLDITVISPDNQIYHPQVLDHVNPSLPATTGIDHINNQEQVIIQDPVPGTWLVHVNSFHLPGTVQRYSIVFPGAYSSLALTGIEPAILEITGEPATLKLHGWSFTRSSEVFWNDKKLSETTWLNPSEMIVQVPPAFFSRPGTASIQVRNYGSLPMRSAAFQVGIHFPYYSYLPYLAGE